MGKVPRWLYYVVLNGGRVECHKLQWFYGYGEYLSRIWPSSPVGEFLKDYGVRNDT